MIETACATEHSNMIVGGGSRAFAENLPRNVAKKSTIKRDISTVGIQCAAKRQRDIQFESRIIRNVDSNADEARDVFIQTA